jgi:hypothetical protein
MDKAPIGSAAVSDGDRYFMPSSHELRCDGVPNTPIAAGYQDYSWQCHSFF